MMRRRRRRRRLSKIVFWRLQARISAGTLISGPMFIIFPHPQSKRLDMRTFDWTMIASFQFLTNSSFSTHPPIAAI